MSPRPRQTSDAEILAATARVMQRRSPTQLTLVDVAKEAGVVPATLIQRFGTKRGLLLALCRTAPGAVPQQFAAARAKHNPPLKALIELYAECTSFAPTPQAMANGLAYLQIDLTDPDFHAITLAQFRALRDETQKHVDGGAMLSWAVYRQGSVAAWVRRDLEALLAPYRTARFGVDPKNTPKKILDITP